MKKITVVVVDDHTLVREMWELVFGAKNEVEVVGSCGDFEESIELIKNKRPDIVFLDINLDGASGMDAVPLIRKYSPGSKIIVVSMHNQPAYAKKMFQMGVKGYVTKNSSHAEMFKAMDEVMAGKTYVCTEIRNTISDHALLEDSSTPSLRELSLREIEIIKLIKNGSSSKEIAEMLHISVRTAEVHRHNVLKKLGLKNTVALINYINKTDLSL